MWRLNFFSHARCGIRYPGSAAPDHAGTIGYRAPRWLRTFLSALCCAVLAACGNGADNAASSAATNSTATNGATANTASKQSPAVAAVPTAAQLDAYRAEVTGAGRSSAPVAQALTADATTAPADGQAVSGIVTLEVRGQDLVNVELLPAEGYLPRWGVFTVSDNGTVARLNFDTQALPNGPLRLRIVAFDKPAGDPNANEIVAMPARTWNISNAAPAPFSAAATVAPADGATLTGVIALEVRGGSLANVELLPAAGYAPRWGIFSMTNGTVAQLAFDTSALPNGPIQMRISAFNKPAGEPDANEIVAMPPRTWIVNNPQPVATPGAVDPLYGAQWHLKNSGQIPARGPAAIPNEDIHVEQAWNACADSTCRGEGVTVAVVDSGVDIHHNDLRENISATLKNHVYLQGRTSIDADPTPTLNDSSTSHGTAVAGIIAARDNNGIGGRGVAPRASLVGYRLIGSSSQSSDMYHAMTYQAADIDVSNNSWGAPALTGQLYPSPKFWEDAIEEGLRFGRKGRGTLYLTSAGNNGSTSQTYWSLSNNDGRKSYRGLIAVAALNAQGIRASYSSVGANVWISAPGGDSCAEALSITTTDLMGSFGYNPGNKAGELADPGYTQCAAGTSFAAPMVSGVAALMLQANPNLGWRDVRTILARTARKNDPAAAWATNGAGHRVHHSYGFGAVDATAAVSAARTWINLPPQKAVSSAPRQVNLPIPDNNDTGVSDTINISNSGISQIEWVDVVFNAADHPVSSDLEIFLISPAGTVSTLAVSHNCKGGCVPYAEWRSGAARYLDEAADGGWRLVVRDAVAADVGTFQDWKITIYGH